MKSGGKELALELEEEGYAGLGIDDDQEAVGKYDGGSANRPARGWRSSRSKPPAPALAAAAARGRVCALRWNSAFPTTHDEEWRFTNVAPIARTRFHGGTQGVVEARLPDPCSWCSPTATC